MVPRTASNLNKGKAMIIVPKAGGLKKTQSVKAFIPQGHNLKQKMAL